MATRRRIAAPLEKLGSTRTTAGPEPGQQTQTHHDRGGRRGTDRRIRLRGADPGARGHPAPTAGPRRARRPGSGDHRLRELPRGGEFGLGDKTGSVVFHADTATMWDAAGASTATPHAAAKAGSDSTGGAAALAPGAAAQAAQSLTPSTHVAAVRVRISATQETLTPDPAMLTAPSTKFPLVIDPAWSGNPVGQHDRDPTRLPRPADPRLHLRHLREQPGRLRHRLRRNDPAAGRGVSPQPRKPSAKRSTPHPVRNLRIHRMHLGTADPSNRIWVPHPSPRSQVFAVTMDSDAESITYCPVGR